MSRSRVRGGVAGLATLAVFAVVLALVGPSRQVPAELRAEQKPAKKRAPEKPISMPANLVGLEILLGLKDKEPSGWGGNVQVSEGRLAGLSVIRGGPNGKADGNRYTARTTRPGGMMQPIAHPILRADLEGPLTATVTVNTRQGKFSFTLSDLSVGKPKTFLDGAASVERNDGALRLTGRDTEDDYPAMARGPRRHGLAGLRRIPARARRSSPSASRPASSTSWSRPGNGDRILLRRFDGKAWQPAARRDRAAASTSGGRPWRWTARASSGSPGPADRRRLGDLPPPLHPARARTTARAQWSDDRPRHQRARRPISTSWPRPTRPGSSGSPGRAGARTTTRSCSPRSADGHAWSEPRVISTSQANDWSPAIAADGEGQRLRRLGHLRQGQLRRPAPHVAGEDARTLTVADSARFEARPHLACDAKDRVWIAYEEGDEQWGKDYAHAGNVKNIGLDEEPRLRPLRQPDGPGEVPGRRQAAAAGRRLEDGAGEHAGDRNKSVPRLAVDDDGRRLAAGAAPPAARAARRGLEQLRPALRRQGAGRRRGACRTRRT